MYITNRHLSRRTVLKAWRDSGAAWLEADGACPARTRGGGRQEGSARRYRDGAWLAGSTAIGIKKKPVAPAAIAAGVRPGSDESRLTRTVRDIYHRQQHRREECEAFTAPEIGGDHFRSSAVS